jgi:hypothetical protein
MSRSYGSPVATSTCEIERLVGDGEMFMQTSVAVARVINMRGSVRRAGSRILQRRQRPAELGPDEMLAIIRRGVVVRQALGLFAGKQRGLCDVFTR